MAVDRINFPSIVAVQQGAGYRIYMLGGEDEDTKILDSCEFIDVGNDHWTLLDAKMSTSRTRARAVLLDHTTVVICGGYDDDTNDLSSCDSLDLTTHTFSPFPDMLVPRYGHAGVHYNGTIVVIGGGYNEKSCEQFDPAVFKWTPFAPLPAGGYTDAVVVECKIYVVVASICSLQVYDGATWSVVTRIPQNYRPGPVVALEGKMVVFNWCQEDADVFDPATNSWSCISMMFQSRRRAVVVSF